MRGDISTALMVLYSIKSELDHTQLISHGLKRYDEHQVAIGTLLAWIHNEGIRTNDVYFASKFALTDAIKDNIPEIKRLVNTAIKELQRASQVLVDV